MVRLLTVFLLGLLLIAGAPNGRPALAAPEPDAASKFIMDGVARAMTILKEHRLPRPQIEQRLRDELRTGFDVESMARFALGSARRRATPQQLFKLVHEMEELVVHTYTTRVITFGPRVKTDLSNIIKVVSTQAVGRREIIVNTRVNRKGANWVKIDWRLRSRGGRLRIIDVVILGISQAHLYRSEFTSVMRRSGNGIEGLIAALKSKNQLLRMK